MVNVRRFLDSPVGAVLFIVIFIAISFVAAFAIPIAVLLTGLPGSLPYRIAYVAITVGGYWLSERERVKSKLWARVLTLFVGTAALCLLIFTPD